MDISISELDKSQSKNFNRFSDFRNSLYKTEKSFVKEGLSEFNLLLNQSSDFNKDYEWTAYLYSNYGKVVARALLCRRKGSVDHLNLGYFEVIEDKDVFNIVYDHLESMAKSMGVKTIKWPVNANFFHSYRIKKDDDTPDLEPCYLLKSYYKKFFESKNYSVLRTWNNYVVPYEGYRSNCLEGIEFLRSKYDYFDDIKMRHLDKSNFKEDMRLFYSQLSKSFEDKGEYEPVSFEDFYSFYSGLKSIIRSELINFSSYKEKDLGFMISYVDTIQAQRLKDKLEVLLPLPSFLASPIAKIAALIKLQEKPEKVYLSFVGKDDSKFDEEVKGVILKHHLANIEYLDSISFTGDIYFTLLEVGSNSDLQSSKLAKVFNQYVLYSKDMD